VSLRLAELPPGGELKVETDGDGVHKIEIIAKHWGSRIAARCQAPSGHVLVTLLKD